MTTRKKTNWKRILFVTVISGASVVGLLVVVGIGMMLWASSVADELGEPTVVAIAQTVPVAAPAIPLQSASGDSGQTLRLDIKLRDGRFEIVVGPPGSQIRVDGEYAENYYELLEEHEAAGSEGGPTTSISLTAKTSGLVRMMAAFRGGWESVEQQNQITVAIPADLSVALNLDVSQGESRIDLGGLTLVDLDAELSMGDHWLGFSEPVSREMERIRVDGRLGNVEIEGLGNARAREVHASSTMGNFTVDLGGEWRPGEVSELSFEHSMGELFLRVPTTVRIAEDSRNVVWLGETTGLGRGEETVDADAPVLKLDLSTSMGGIRVGRYDDVAEGAERSTDFPSPGS